MVGVHCPSWPAQSQEGCTREAAERVKREIEARLALGDIGISREKTSVSFPNTVANGSSYMPRSL